MTRSIGSLFVASALLLLTACAQSFHPVSYTHLTLPTSDLV